MGRDRSEFECLPHEMLERMDRIYVLFGIPPQEQIRRVFGHYRRNYLRQENERLLELEPKALSGDKAALDELNKALLKRAEQRETTLEQEFARLREKRESLGIARQAPQQEQPTGPQSVTTRLRKKS